MSISYTLVVLLMNRFRQDLILLLLLVFPVFLLILLIREIRVVLRAFRVPLATRVTGSVGMRSGEERGV